MPIADVDYQDTGCRYYPSCLNCGEPDECKLVKMSRKATPEELKERKRERDRLYHEKHREELIRKRREKYRLAKERKAIC